MTKIEISSEITAKCNKKSRAVNITQWNIDFQYQYQYIEDIDAGIDNELRFLENIDLDLDIAFGKNIGLDIDLDLDCFSGTILILVLILKMKF